MDPYDAIADPVRRRIVELLARQPMPAGQVAEAFPDISRPAVSRHLRVLRETGLVDAELVGRQRIHTADIGALSEVTDWIAGLAPAAWTNQLDALETEVHRTRRERERREQQDKRATGPIPTTKERSA